jgi:hypothetical protein
MILWGIGAGGRTVCKKWIIWWQRYLLATLGGRVSLELVRDRPKVISVLSSRQPMDLAVAISFEGHIVALQQQNASLPSRRLSDLSSRRLRLVC